MNPHQPVISLRNAQTEGSPAYLAYTPDGNNCFVAGESDFVRCFHISDQGEPERVDLTSLGIFSVAASGNSHFIVGGETGAVCRHSIEDKLLERIIVRHTSAVRDVAVSPDGDWCASTGEEDVVKIAHVHDASREVRYLRHHGDRRVKHLSWDPSNKFVAASCTNGDLYLYSTETEEPTVFHYFKGILSSLEFGSLASSRAVWHPDGRTFAFPTPTRDIKVISVEDQEYQRTFTGRHNAPISALVWSPNGALLISASTEDDTLAVWETKTQKPLRTFSYEKITQMAWHPTANLLSWTNSLGELAFNVSFLEDDELSKLLKGPKQPSPYIHDPLKEVSGNSRRLVNGHGPKPPGFLHDEVPNLTDGDSDMDLDGEDNWIEDDDGAGYTNGINGNGKRTGEHLVNGNGKRSRGVTWAPQIHQSFQPGETVWRGNRKYLCWNIIGTVWTVEHDTHRTVTVDFSDTGERHGFHFTDVDCFDKACLNENGTLFACESRDGKPSMIFYRPHETWTNRPEWRTNLPRGEEATAMALSDSQVVVTTTAGYVRIYTLFGTPIRIHRLKSSPIVTCASHGELVMTISNGPVGSDGCTQLVYTIENVHTNEVYQSEDVVALPPGATLKTLLFSNQGDPYIYDSTGTLLTLLHWRRPRNARWTPVFDTANLEHLQSGRKEESYWPVAVHNDEFYCAVLKGKDQYPYFPKPSMMQYQFRVPLPLPPNKERNKRGQNQDEEKETDDQARPRLEEELVRQSVGIAMLTDALATSPRSSSASSARYAEIARKELDYNRILLQLLAVECREDEKTGMKALELVKLVKGGDPKVLNGARKVAERYGRMLLLEKIDSWAESRALNVEEEDGPY